MATVRIRGTTVEYIVKCKPLADAGKIAYPIYETCNINDKESVDRTIALYEGMLRRGVVPDDWKIENRPETKRGKANKAASSHFNLRTLIERYIEKIDPPDDDRVLLGVIVEQRGDALVATLDYHWADSWVTYMKQQKKLAPGTIRHYVGALGRAVSWYCVQPNAELKGNPIQLLLRNYSKYTRKDVEIAGTHRYDDERTRRLEPGEYEKVLAVFNGAVAPGKQRPLTMPHLAALECMYDLALHTCMRMREMYTLSMDQVRFDIDTIALDKTKNGDQRQVPIFAPAAVVLRKYLRHVEDQDRGMEGFRHENKMLFPWFQWQGDPRAPFIGDADKAALKHVTSKLSAQYRRIFQAAGAKGLRFHDHRHEAISRLYETTNFRTEDIMKMSGHTSEKMQQRYNNMRASVLVAKMKVLDAAKSSSASQAQAQTPASG